MSNPAPPTQDKNMKISKTIYIPPLQVPVGMRADIKIIFNSIDCESGDGTLEIQFCDEGGGYFVEMSTDGTLKLDAPELQALADWCAKTCVCLDDQNAK